MNVKSFIYKIDLEKPEKGPKITFTGMWSRAEVDKMNKLALRELRRYKAELIRKEEKKND